MGEDQFVSRAPRLPLDVEVNCGAKGAAYSKNISETGIALLSDYPLEQGTYIQMKFTLPGEELPVNAYGKVVRSAPVSDNYHESGIAFWDIEDADKKRIEAYFAQRT